MTRKVCSVAGCGGTHRARGYCTKHYAKLRRYGDPTRVVKINGGTLSERFMAHSAAIRKGEGCWEWVKEIGSFGYGVFSYAGVNRLAHRVSYELSIGEIPSGMIVRHKCDNPPCVRPGHLELGTLADNNRDAARRGRTAHGERNARAVLTESQVREIRGLAGLVFHKDIAIMYGVSKSTVDSIIAGTLWRRVK